jgi:hypothetical protein
MSVSIVLVVVIVAAIAIAVGGVRRRRPGAAVPKAAAVTPTYEVDDDRVALIQLRAAGADLSRPTELRHYLYLPTRAQAEQATAELVARGFVPEVRTPRGLQPDGHVETDWAVVAVETHVPSPEHLHAARVLFARLATTFGGSYDGWDAGVTR